MEFPPTTYGAEAFQTGARSARWAKPTLVLRHVESADIKTGSGRKAVGVIDPLLVPLRLDVEPVPRGHTLTVQPVPARKPEDRSDAYWFDALRDPDDIANWSARTFTLEHRRSLTSRALQEIKFRGNLASKSVQWDENRNGYTLRLSDMYELHSPPIYVEGSPLFSAGALFQALNDGYYTAHDLDPNVGYRTRKFKLFPQHPMPSDAAGRNIVNVDAELLSNTTTISGAGLKGQPTAVAFAEIVRVIGGKTYFPILRYDGSDMVLTMVRAGHKKRTLVIGAPRKTDPTTKYVPDVMSIAGTINYETVFNSIQGRGGLTRTVDKTELIPAWDRSLDAAVLANPTLASRPGYEDVGRKFRAEKKIWPMNPVPTGGVSGAQSDRPLFWRESPAKSFHEFDPGNVKIQSGRADKSTSGTKLDRKSDARWESGDHTFVKFSEVQRYSYFTSSQQALRAAGISQTPNVGFWDLEVQAVQIGPQLTVNTGVRGDHPSVRTKIHENPEATKTTHVVYYISQVAGRGEGGVNTGFDHTAAFQFQASEIAEAAARPDTNVTVTLWYLDFSIEIGEEIEAVMDCEGTVHWDDPQLIVESFSHDLQSYRTSFTVASAKKAGVLAV